MRLFRLLRQILREVFEESVYERFCTREKLGVGVESYSRFLRDSEPTKHPRVRCC